MWQVRNVANSEKIKSNDPLKIVFQSCKLLNIAQLAIGVVAKGIK